MKKQNHPVLGSILSVEPIRNPKDILTIKKRLDNPRDFAIFVVGINTAFRASDLLNITVGQVRHLGPGDTLPVREKKTRKERRVTLNKSAHDAIRKLLVTFPEATPDDAWLFQSRKKKGKLLVSTLNTMVQEWCSWCNLPGRQGSHSLRKTFGYQHRVQFGTDLPTLMTVFGHSTQQQTLHYLCIQAEDVKEAFMREI